MTFDPCVWLISLHMFQDTYSIYSIYKYAIYKYIYSICSIYKNQDFSRLSYWKYAVFLILANVSWGNLNSSIMQLKFELWLIWHMLFVYIVSNYLIWFKNPTSKRNSENSPHVGTLTPPEKCTLVSVLNFHQCSNKRKLLFSQ